MAYLDETGAMAIHPSLIGPNAGPMPATLDPEALHAEIARAGGRDCDCAKSTRCMLINPIPCPYDSHKCIARKLGGDMASVHNRCDATWLAACGGSCFCLYIGAERRSDSHQGKQKYEEIPHCRGEDHWQWSDGTLWDFHCWCVI